MIGARVLMPLSRVAAPVKMAVQKFPALNAVFWDIQYRLGLWNELDRANGAQLVALLETHTDRPRILDLGCGKGVNLHLPTERYRHYHGVDISPASIKLARKHARPNMSFEAADILRYETAERYDAILLREVIYYLPQQKIPDFLHRIAGFLEPDGKIFVQCWDRTACGEYVDLVLGAGLGVIEEQVKQSGDGPQSVVTVLRPLADAMPGALD